MGTLARLASDWQECPSYGIHRKGLKLRTCRCSFTHCQATGDCCRNRASCVVETIDDEANAMFDRLGAIYRQALLNAAPD